MNKFVLGCLATEPAVVVRAWWLCLRVSQWIHLTRGVHCDEVILSLVVVELLHLRAVLLGKAENAISTKCRGFMREWRLHLRAEAGCAFSTTAKHMRFRIVRLRVLMCP